MSFDIFLARFERGELAEAPKEAVLAVLRGRKHTGPDQHGFYAVDLPGGDSVEFSARGLESEGEFQRCAFHVRRFGPGLAEFLFDVAKAGRFAIVPAMDGNPIFLVEEGMATDLPADTLETLRPVFVVSATDLRDALAQGFTGWAEYRNHVVGGKASSQEGEGGGPTRR